MKTAGAEFAGYSFFAEVLTPRNSVRATLRTCSPRVSERWTENCCELGRDDGREHRPLDAQMGKGLSFNPRI